MHAARERLSRLSSSRTDLFLAGLNLGLGVALMVGGPARTSSASFQIAKNALPIHVWAALFLVVALLGFSLSSRPVLASWTLVAGFVLYTFWGGALVSAAIDNPAASLTGIVVYLGLALLHLSAGVGLTQELRRANRFRGR